MPLKINKRCKVCQVIDEGDNRLLKRIYACSRFRTDGESLKSIHADYENRFGYIALSNHARKHQAVKASDLKKSIQNEIISSGSNAAAIEILATADVRQKIMRKGLKGIETGKIKIRASDVLRAAKDQDDVEAKKGDQALLAAELMMRIASGELKPTGEINGEIPRGDIEGPIVAGNSATFTDPTSSPAS